MRRGRNADLLRSGHSQLIIMWVMCTAGIDYHLRIRLAVTKYSNSRIAGFYFFLIPKNWNLSALLNEVGLRRPVEPTTQKRRLVRRNVECGAQLIICWCNSPFTSALMNVR